MADRRFGDGSRGAGAVVPTGDVIGPANLVHVQALVDMGCLVSLSRSRDGGAVSVTVTFDGEWEREWFRDAESANLQLEEWRETLAPLARADGHSPAANQGTRRRRSGGRRDAAGG
jgi:hypothetical protein